MPTIETSAGALWYDVIDLTPPWDTDPETVLFLHGVGIEHRIWHRWWPVVGPRLRIAVMDMRGYGRSPAPADGYRWSLEGIAADALAVADAAGAERFHFVGESAGGAVGYWLAINRPERLRSLVACTSPHLGANIRGLSEWRRTIESRGMGAWSEKMLDSRFAADSIGEAERRWFDAAQRSCDARAVLDLADMLGEVDLSDGLPNIDTPTLMIGGDSSPVLPPATLADTHSRVPGAELRLFEAARHGVVLSHGAAAARATLDFLDRRT